MNISAQIISLHYQVFDSLGRKPRIRPHWRAAENNSPCLGFIWLIIEASIIGNLYSMSFCSRRALGDRVEAFERDLREAVLTVEPSGRLSGEPYGLHALMVWKR